jgi:hypothetical protein
VDYPDGGCPCTEFRRSGVVSDVLLFHANYCRF